MPTDPLTAIWRRLDRDPPLFFEEQLEGALGGARERVFALGLIRADRPSVAAPCRDCGAVGRVEWLDRARSGRRDAYIRCPTCGPVGIDPDALRQWAISTPDLLAAVRGPGRFRGAATELVGGHLWHLGNATWLGRPREAYFARGVHDGNRPHVATALATRPKAVLFFPTEAAAHGWSGATANPVVALESVVALAPDGLTFDASVVEGRLSDAGFDAPGPRRPRRRAERTAKIERLEKELREWLTRARSHADATRRLSGTPQLLKRLTQQDLATMAEVAEYDVSRCLADPDAAALRRLWAIAADVDRILGWDGFVGNDPP